MYPLINHYTVERPLPLKDLLVEIGFGRGEFTVKLARENPDRKVLGVETSGISVEKLLRRVLREGLRNVLIAHMDAYWCFNLLLKEGSVERIYMNYPDPWFKKRHTKRRITKEENLYVFAKRLRQGGEILIRTDHHPFVEYTIEQAKGLGCFEASVRTVTVEDPLTKYERRWVSMGREIYELRLSKLREPEPRPVRTVKEVVEVFPVKVEGREPAPDRIAGREFKLGEGIYLKTFGFHRTEDTILVEALLSEMGFVQKFYIEFRRKGSAWVVDVSRFSQVIRTENLQRSVEVLAQEGFTP